jgi:hypothetical protein
MLDKIPHVNENVFHQIKAEAIVCWTEVSIPVSLTKLT